MKAAWGLPTKDPNAKFCWGARAIYKMNFEEVTIDIPWDRQDWEGEHTKEERLALSTWINTRAMNHLKIHLSKRGIGISSDQYVSIDGDGFHLCASPKASHGHLYIVAEPCAESTTVLEPIPEPQRKKPKNARRSY